METLSLISIIMSSICLFVAGALKLYAFAYDRGYQSGKHTGFTQGMFHGYEKKNNSRIEHNRHLVQIQTRKHHQLEVNNIRFPKEVEKYAKMHNASYIDSVIAICEQFGIEPQVAAKFLSKPIIQKIKIEGQELNLLPKTSKLPL